MTDKRREDDDNVRALDHLNRGSERPRAPRRPPEPSPAPTPPAAEQPHTPPPIELEPAPAEASATAETPPRAASPHPAAPDADHPPAFRCLSCGYPLVDDAAPRCSECGHAYERSALRDWFSGEEEKRFEAVNWLILAILFLKLLLLPQLLWVSRLATAVAAGWACYLARKGKQGSPGAYYGVAGMTAAGLMLLASAGSDSGLSFHTLDIIAACLLLLSVLHDPAIGRIGTFAIGGRVALVLLFLAPLFAVVCFVLALAVRSQVTLPSLLKAYPPFQFIVPYLAAAGAWLLAWRTIATVRRRLFQDPDD